MNSCYFCGKNSERMFFDVDKYLVLCKFHNMFIVKMTKDLDEITQEEFTKGEKSK